ncbi:hypothetical protein PBAL39_13140 [Pedobacter sp. BAL39]|nr:hypothetical protein PBAL39_13140 [Pedobacter sp. BAL39]
MELKYKNMNIKLLIGLILLSGFLSSCKKWLEVQPESEISAPILFSTESGFIEALNGIYNRCTESDLYGGELTFGTLEVLAQNYTMNQDDNMKYRQTSLFNYKNREFIDRKDKIWIGLYNGIVNTNLILENIDEKKNIFNGNNYSVVKGEALALRAYLHFDALRMFAASYVRNPSAKGIPYVTKYSKDVTPMSTVAESIDLMIKDLEAAKELLTIDPIRSASYVVGYPVQTDTTLNGEEKSPQLFLQNRRHHLNYYAVCGTLARIYLYKNDKVKALSNALEVINSKKFPWTSPSDFIAFEEAKKDRILYKELVFGWYIPGAADDIRDKWFTSGTSKFYLQDDLGKIIYETAGTGADDNRYKQWLSSIAQPSGERTSDIVKYRRNPLSKEENANLHYLMAPALRLSEMYYIAAECTATSNLIGAADYLNKVRAARGMVGIEAASEEQLTTELLKEARKEWLAEGQMFYMYKRLNRPISGQTGSFIPASDNIYILPLPNDEIVYGGR